MRRLVSLSLAVLALTTSSSALAAEPRPPERAQFITFDLQAFTGTARTPGFELMRTREGARFARMLELKKDLVPGIGAARQDLLFK